MRRHSETISEEDASYALEELKTSLIKRIEEKDYEFLLNIYIYIYITATKGG